MKSDANIFNFVGADSYHDPRLNVLGWYRDGLSYREQLRKELTKRLGHKSFKTRLFGYSVPAIRGVDFVSGVALYDGWRYNTLKSLEDNKIDLGLVAEFMGTPGELVEERFYSLPPSELLNIAMGAFTESLETLLGIIKAIPESLNNEQAYENVEVLVIKSYNKVELLSCGKKHKIASTHSGGQLDNLMNVLINNRPNVRVTDSDFGDVTDNYINDYSEVIRKAGLRPLFEYLGGTVSKKEAILPNKAILTMERFDELLRKIAENRDKKHKQP